MYDIQKEKNKPIEKVAIRDNKLLLKIFKNCTQQKN